jgi:Uma2 family endonuclease
MGLPQEKSKFDAAAYLAWEAAQPNRNEYIAGEVVAKLGVSKKENIAMGNLAIAFRSALKGSACQVYITAIQTRIESANCYFYPDVVVSCDARDRATPDYISHPILVVEVLSESTAAFDRGDKFAAYRKLQSLQEYVLVDLPAKRIEIFRRNAEQHWVLYEYTAGETIEFASLGLSLPVAMVLEDTDEAPAETEPAPT